MHRMVGADPYVIFLWLKVYLVSYNAAPMQVLRVVKFIPFFSMASLAQLQFGSLNFIFRQNSNCIDGDLVCFTATVAQSTWLASKMLFPHLRSALMASKDCNCRENDDVEACYDGCRSIPGSNVWLMDLLKPNERYPSHGCICCAIRRCRVLQSDPLCTHIVKCS
jgi:hypothetical protein